MEIADADDVRLVERAERVELAPKTAPPGVIGDDERMEALDGDGFAGRFVNGSPDVGRTAAAGALEQPVAIEQDRFRHGAMVADGSGQPAKACLALAFQPCDGIGAITHHERGIRAQMRGGCNLTATGAMRFPLPTNRCRSPGSPMHIRRSAALAATLVLAIVPIVASGAVAGGRSGATSLAARQTAEHNRIVKYWTEARLRAATPRDFVFDPVRGFHLAPQRKPGGGGTGGGNTTGASWPNGTGLVYKATGKVYFVMGSSAYVCSGTALGDSRSGYSLVITAGHCVYDEETGNGQLSGFATNWLFIPQFDSSPTFTCANTAFGCWTAQALVVNRGFAGAGGFTTTATHYDWGFAVVGPGGKSGAPLDSVVGTFGYSASAMSGGTTVDAFGYPAAGKYHGNDLVYCQGPVGFDALTSNTNYKLACGMTGGSSGGPWLSGFNATTGTGGTIQSLNSYGYSGQSNMYGPIFNATTTATYDAANKATANTIVN